ncbi:NADP-dependent phosphogluconate dehydrogenase [Rhodocytophaga aerolata]|uniref:6-phosphogluconate dehydrogenase, decarboxylating n=1 Tax=Rhodocytophaga aerolata TaxID=455078 RepID=A0ABT8R5U7_9BACT|nr:NADP-dependent phosphogluconate dehydrogenase [Rhodocytophaga aerolata]MDO1446142.1 NADP-dependent phosphogluconate dehydrogenase [Rhodocytophaga aerolata]
MQLQQYEFGMIGLGVMGRNLLLNMADHGFSVAGYNRDPSKVADLKTEAAGKNVFGTSDLKEFVLKLKRPRAIMLLVTAGKAVDMVINELLPMLQPGDLVIDGGNSYYADTDRRTQELTAKGIHFLGVGVSGGESGARFGPSMMPGGSEQAYEVVRPIFESIAAKVNNEPCVTYLGPSSAGHYVKMVHNGIEYGIMQLISEAYDILKRGIGLSNDELHTVFKEWNNAELKSFLIEITANIFLQPDEQKEGRLVDYILDSAKQKGTGKWTSQCGMDLGVPLSIIDVAVTSRYLSALKQERVAAAKTLSGPKSSFNLSGDKQAVINQVKDALYFATIGAYAQGMHLLKVASDTYGYNLKLDDVARIWRGGCIIRATLLEDITNAYKKNPDLANLLVDPSLAAVVAGRQDSTRKVLGLAITAGLPVPALSAALAYFDAYRTDRLPSNLIQAQRDNFGAHTYERIDTEGIFHTHWQ